LKRLLDFFSNLLATMINKVAEK